MFDLRVSVVVIKAISSPDTIKDEQSFSRVAAKKTQYRDEAAEKKERPQAKIYVGSSDSCILQIVIAETRDTFDFVLVQ